jgi:putative membrane protein
MDYRTSRARALVGGSAIAVTLLLAPAAAEARGLHVGGQAAVRGKDGGALAQAAAERRAEFVQRLAQGRAAVKAQVAERVAAAPGAHDGKPGPGPTTAGTRPQGGDGALSPGDQAFLATAAQAAKFEVRSGALAVNRGDDCSVRVYGAAMVFEHSLQSLDEHHVAGAVDASLPTDVSAAQAAQLDTLRGLSGAAFDQAYAGLAVTSHQQAESLFATAASSADSPKVRWFAARWLPGIRRHLAHARKLQADVADNGTTTTTRPSTSTTTTWAGTTSTTMNMDHARA